MSGTTALTGRTAERIDDHGIADTVRYIAPFFTSADLGHLSNEVAFVKGCHPWTGQEADELIFCARDRYIDLIAALHVTIIELTGSHLRDYGARSLARTIEMYAKRGWIWFGGGRTQIEATEPRIVEHHGNRLAFVGCNHVNWWIKAIYTGLGTAHCDYPRLVWQIQDLRRRGYTVIASVQHRELMTHKPDWDLVADLRKLAEAGATFVQGSQAHTAHPWDVHHGAYVHYGPGNILFAQYPEVQREAAVDKLYIHAGTLLTVGHLLVRSEHGQPRELTSAERARFMDQMATAAAQIAKPDPDAPVTLPPASRDRPDAMVARGRSQKLAIRVPAQLEAGATYPAVIALGATPPPADDAAFVIARAGKSIATADELAAFVRAKYPVDPKRVTFVGEDPKPSRSTCGRRRRPCAR